MLKNESSNNHFKILIIDDDNSYAERIVDSLKQAIPEVHLQFYTSGNVAEVKRLSETNYFDLALLDIMLEESSDIKPVDVGSFFHSMPISSSIENLDDSPKAKDNQPVFITLPKSSDTFDDDLIVAIRRLIHAKQWEENLKSGLILPIEQSIIEINNRLINIFKNDPDLLRKIDPIMFEEVVAELFEEEGYEIVLTPPRADGGKDIYVYKTDTLTQTKYLVECKRYVPPLKVDVSIARQLYGVVQQEQATGGIIVTTSYFTKPAKDFAQKVPFQLFLTDFDDLSRWLNKIK
jgi:HJR/Mrr/RecB family endonuclease